MKRPAGIRLIMAIAAACLSCTGCEPPNIAINETPVTIAGDVKGHGRAARPGDIVCIDYRVLLPDGTEILRDEDFCFHLGAGAVIAGFDEGIPGMRPGGRRVIQCPPHKHWGSRGYGEGKSRIPPNTTLSLHIELKSIE
jgi:FKBP-type peptidyl-prolyl cis-trans isomerase